MIQEPVRVVLGERRICTGSGEQRKSTLKEETMMYVPILETLQVMLENKAIFTEVCLFLYKDYSLYYANISTD